VIENPWKDGPGRDGLWISSSDRARIDRVNVRLPSDDGRRLNYLTSSGKPLVPGAWSGDPWSAPIVLLLLNPAVSPFSEKLYADINALRHVEAMTLNSPGRDYPNAWLHPSVRQHEPWCSKVVCGALHRYMTEERGLEVEEAWRLLARKIAILELSAWTSHKWSHHAFVETSRVSVELAKQAMEDSSRIVLLGRGEADWKSAGLVDVDLLPLSRGVRSNQSRITPKNFPTVWEKITNELKRP
jgi:hypothetical protein